MFAATLTAAVFAILQNCRGYAAIGLWLSEQPLDFLHALRFWRTPPTASGVSKLLSRIDVTALEDPLTRWIHDVLPDSAATTDFVPVAMDGKSLRGTWDRLNRAVHLLNVIDQQTKTVLHQRLVPGDTNEHQIALEVLKDLVLTGRVITADAAFCRRDVCQIIVDRGWDYLLPVKDNQPQLVAAISSEFTADNAVFSPHKFSVNARPNDRRPPATRRHTVARNSER